jgi:hypothetical protein
MRTLIIKKTQSGMISVKQKSKKRESKSERTEIRSKGCLTLVSDLCYNTLYFSDNDKECDERQDYSS